MTTSARATFAMLWRILCLTSTKANQRPKMYEMHSMLIKYLLEDTTSKKFLASKFMNYRMVDARSIVEQINEILHVLSQFGQHNMKMDEEIAVSSIIDKLPPS
jgi:hypothetical protein